jgi:signal transduction histidine kinase
MGTVAKDDHLGGSSAATLVLAEEPRVELDRELLARVREAFADHAADVVESAESRTRSLESVGSADPHIALLFAADALTAVALDCGWSACDVELLIAEAAAACGVTNEEARRTIFLYATHNPCLLGLPPRLAMEFHLRLLAAVAPLQEVTLWTGGESTRAECLLSVGTETLTRRVRAVARLTLAADCEEDLDQGFVLGVRVLRWQRPCGALVLRRSAGDRGRALVYARETAAAMALVFERDTLLERNARRERSLVEASEKRLARLGYDLHDGPLQDLASLLGEIKLARSQVPDLLAAAQKLVDSRLQELESRAEDINRLLRELAISLEPKHILELPLGEVFRREIEAFERRTGIETLLDVSGDFSELTASQRLALFRVAQEALTNVREHSDATVIQVSLHAGVSSTELRVIDNGNGFEVTRVLIDAARRGRLGLAGISERVRMLGGTFDVISRQDEYTEVYVSLPVWRPLTAVAAVERLGAV